MAADVVLAVDVGGSTLAGAVVTADGHVSGTVRRLDVAEGGDTPAVVAQLAGLVADLRRAAASDGLVPVGVGVGVPGPFDLARGVSRMAHKLRGLLGVPLRPPLEDAAGVPVSFCNDADAFALGAWWRQYRNEPRLLGITLGTGLGAGFVVDGRPAEGDRVPAGGEIWNLPYRDGVLEDAVSRRALERRYEQETGERRTVDVIADRARHGDEAAATAFGAFGDDLGDGLGQTIALFAPTRIVCGGQIAKAFDLFGDRAASAYAAATGTTAPLSPAIADELSLIGAARHVRS